MLKEMDEQPVVLRKSSKLLGKIIHSRIDKEIKGSILITTAFFVIKDELPHAGLG